MCVKVLVIVIIVFKRYPSKIVVSFVETFQI